MQKSFVKTGHPGRFEEMPAAWSWCEHQSTLCPWKCKHFWKSWQNRNWYWIPYIWHPQALAFKSYLRWQDRSTLHGCCSCVRISMCSFWVATTGSSGGAVWVARDLGKAEFQFSRSPLQIKHTFSGATSMVSDILSKLLFLPPTYQHIQGWQPSYNLESIDPLRHWRRKVRRWIPRF